MEPQIGELGQGDNRRSTLWAFLERPCVLSFSQGPLEVVADQNASRLPAGPCAKTRLSHERRVSVARKLNATLRVATGEIVAKRADRNVQHGDTVVEPNASETVPRVSRARRQNQRAAPEKNASQALRKPSHREDADLEYKPRRQQMGNGAQGKKSDHSDGGSRFRARREDLPPPGTYCDARLSKTAPIYHDVVAGERVLVNYIPDDPCTWESTDDEELSACQQGVTPSDYTDDSGRIIPRYRQHMDKVYRKVLRQVAQELRKYARGQYRTRTGEKDSYKHTREGL